MPTIVTVRSFPVHTGTSSNVTRKSLTHKHHQMGLFSGNANCTSREQQDNCIFCRIARGQESNKILYEDENFVAFRDMNPAAAEHFLVITKAHVASVYSLQPCVEDIRLVEDMVTIGNRLLRSAAPEQRKFGFHYPPFNSVMHLHLHCFKLPHKWWLQHKYMEKDNAWAGYMTAEQVLERLRAQMKQASREQS